MTTTTATLPEFLQGKYEIVKPISGGPVFALPQLGISNIDFSKMTEKEAETLVRKGWKGIRRVEAPPRPSPQGEGVQALGQSERDATSQTVAEAIGLDMSVFKPFVESLKEKPADTAGEAVPEPPVQGQKKRQ